MATEEEKALWKAQNEHYKQLKKQCVGFVCAECGGEFIVRWIGDSNDWEAICCWDRQHKGAKKRLTPTEAYHQGYALPLPVVERIEKRERRKGK